MAETGASRGRSQSGDFDESDFESHAGDSANQPGKPGRKKNPNSQAARRDQNRIAQREFRLRKQQRIRDLEARVEILSGGKDEAETEMRNMLKDLMAENQTLRNLLRSLSAFIGEGAGGLLPKLGWDLSDFNSFVNRSETDTAWEGYHKRKRAQDNEGASSGSSHPHKRPADGDASDLRAKRPRGRSEQANEQTPQNGFQLLVPMSSSVGPNGIFPPSRQDGNPNFSDMMHSSNGSPMFMQPPAPSGSIPQYSAPATNMGNYNQAPYLPGGVSAETSITSLSYNPSASGGQGSTQQAPVAPLERDDDDPSKNEAYKLVSYHLDNFKRNSTYCLPSSLRPTLVQRTVPHESVIDRILHPDLRDRMILLRGRYDLVDCLMDYRKALTIHGDDVLVHGNWEIGEKWLRTYGFLVDRATLDIANRWRRERGEPEIRMSDIAGSEATPSDTAT